MLHLNDNKDKTLQEYIDIYQSKTKEEFKPTEGFKLYYMPNRGFCEIKLSLESGMVMIYQLCGDLRFWADFAILLGRTFGLKAIGSYYIRDNAKAYIRLLDYKITSQYELKSEDGNVEIGYTIRNKEGLTGRFTPCHIHQDKNKVAYMITFGVNINDEL